MTSLAHKCFRWRFAVLGGWLVALLGLAVLTLGVGTAFTDSAELPDSESGTAYSLLADAGASGSSSTGATQSGTIVWHTDTAAIDDAGVRTDFAAMLEQVSALPGVASVVSPYTQAGAGQLNESTNTAYASVVVGEDADVEPVVQAAENCAAAGWTSRSVARRSPSNRPLRAGPR